MSKSFQFLAFYALLLSLIQSLSSYEAEKIPFNLSQIQYKSNEFKEYSETITIEVDTDSKHHQDVVVGYNGTFSFASEFNENASNIFDRETIEQETSFTTFMIDENQHILNTTCRFWMPEDKIIIFCDANFFEKGFHSVRIGNQSFEYRSKYLINVHFYGRKNFIFEQLDTYLPFIYSAGQNINIKESQPSYEIKFKFNMYNNEILHIYGKTKYNYLALDNCEKIDKELICKISKEKIEETLISSKEKFKLLLINDTNGLINCVHVFPITINYQDIQKEVIYIKLEKILGRITEAFTSVAFETNVTEIPNLISDNSNIIQNSYSSYFKKMTGKKLILFAKYNIEGENMPIPSAEKEIFLNNIHYKYTFIIEPFKFNETITVHKEGALVYFVYPEKIDFTSSNSAIIRFYMDIPSLDIGIKLNPDSELDLECKNLNSIKRCVVPASHFNGKENGTYNVYHKNHAGDSNIYYELPLINVTLPEKENITELNFESREKYRTKYIGYQGILNFVLDFNDTKTNIFNASDIEEKTNSETTIVVDNTDIINVNCKLWKPIEENLNIFCKLSKNLTYGSHSYSLSSFSFYYNSKKFAIVQQERLSLFQVDQRLPFLYSSKQVLNIDENINTYHLTFKFVEYHNECLMIPVRGFSQVITLDECFIEGNEVKCKIEKDSIEEYVSYNGEKLSVLYFYSYKEASIYSGDFNIYSIYGIYINYPLIKQNVSVEIIKLLEDNINTDNFIAYETNVKIINNLHSNTFFIDLSDGNKTLCSMKKTIGTSLLMICRMEKEGEFSLAHVENQIELNDINIKYNFVIQPINSDEKFKISGEGGFMMFSLPKVLDFTLHEKITVDFGMSSSENLKGIRLNPEANDLECSNRNSMYKRCSVHKSHFMNKNSGYYYTHHSNNNNKSIIFYESSPLRVILSENKIYILIKKENNKEKIKLRHENATFALVTDYNDKGKKIFDKDDIINFNGIFISKEKGDEYKASCKLWVPNSDNSRIICKCNDYISSSDIYLNYTVVTYNNYKIIIEQKELVEFEFCNDYVSFLYSDRQTINITDNKKLYELKFKIEEYYKEPFYIYGSNNNYANLDNCSLDLNEITCKITKENLEEILVEKNEQFKIGAMNETLGIISFEHILNITINYEIAQKQDIYLEIKEIIGGTTEIGVPVGLVTNVTEIPNFISAKFEDMKYFKKVSGRPLILFYNYSFEIEYDMQSNYTEEVVKNDIHYKYNFRIQASKFEGRISVRGKGSNILFIYPQELIYNDKEETFKIMYIMNEPENVLRLKLNQDARYNLQCTDLYKMKVCSVPKSHFDGKESGNYYTNIISIYNQALIYYDSSPIKIAKPLELNIIQLFFDIYIGTKGIMYFRTDYNDAEKNIFNDSNIEKDTKFKISFSSKDKKYSNIPCHLWKNTQNIIYIFCKLNENLSFGNNYINIDRTKFIYNKLEINIIQKDKILFVYQLEKPLPFLYSKSQIINFEEGKNTYYLKFKADNYQNEKLIINNNIMGNIILDNCSMDKKELICKIDKTVLEEYYLDGNYIEIYNPYFRRRLIRSFMVDLFRVNYTSQKIDLKITINKLLENYTDIDNLIAYEVEANETNISNIASGIFKLNFEYGNEIEEQNCFFKKTNKNPFYLLCDCFVEHNISISLSEIKDELPITNKHGKYNFYIQPIKKNDKITIEGMGSALSMIIPKILNFTTNEEISIELFMVDFNYTKGIRFNLNADKDLVCETLYLGKRCIVHKSHFKNKQSGYYNIYHLNHMNKYIRFYEYSPIQVILQELIITIKNIDDKNSIKIGQKGVIALLSEFEDLGNIFNISDIEVETANKIIFSDNNKNYTANCHLWKPIGEKLRLICKFNENIETQNIKLNEFFFKYKNYKIIMYSESNLNITQLNSRISFLYSDKQEINITENITEYSLVFKKGVYNKEPLILYKDNNKLKNIYLNCLEETKEIKCSISKDKLIGILSQNDNEFYLSQLTESEGILKFENVKAIKIYYSNIKKKDIYLSITKLVTKTVEKNNYIVFETNTTDIPIITTDLFQIPPNSNNKMNCLFKKTNNQKDDKLLLLCNADSKGIYQLNINETNLDNINILYSFKIPATIISEKVNVTDKEGAIILSVYPDLLDFNTSEHLTIKYYTENPAKLKGIKLNYDSPELLCTDKNGIKECTVNKSHFKESGYYYTYYTNSLGDKVISYEIPKIQIILKEKEGNGGNEGSNKTGIIVGCVIGGIALIAVIVIIIILVKKKKKDNSSEIIGDKSLNKILPNSEDMELVVGDKFGNE